MADRKAQDMKWRYLEEKVFQGLMIAATLLAALVLLIILGTILFKGAKALSLEMLFRLPKGGYYLGREGGILNAIVGSLQLAGGATLLALTISLPIVFYLNYFTRPRSLWPIITRFSLDVLWGVPSIVYGAFGFLLMTWLDLKASLLLGIITLAFLEIPIMGRAMDEVFKLVPRDLLDASFSLGATRWETAWKVVLRQTLPGIVTAILIAFGRAIGDAASVLLTAGYTDNLTTSLFQPVASLPLAIFFQLGTPYPEVQQRAYAAAIILTLIILAVSFVSRRIARHYSRHLVL
ncbi:MAG: phosphate ABC transporter permease PstA [Candidatus Aminicenantes bacterium]|nr:phosphate ABC transporter permease PstA [Candidatus Aminicenantes bacterium]